MSSLASKSMSRLVSKNNKQVMEWLGALESEINHWNTCEHSPATPPSAQMMTPPKRLQTKNISLVSANGGASLHGMPGVQIADHVLKMFHETALAVLLDKPIAHIIA